MNRRGFFGLLAAVALLPKRAVGQLTYKAYTFRYRPAPKYGTFTFRIVSEDLYAKTRICEQQWENDVFVTRLPVAYRIAIGRRVKATIALSKGRYRHICRWTESG